MMIMMMLVSSLVYWSRWTASLIWLLNVKKRNVPFEP